LKQFIFDIFQLCSGQNDLDKYTDNYAVIVDYLLLSYSKPHLQSDYKLYNEEDSYIILQKIFSEIMYRVKTRAIIIYHKMQDNIIHEHIYINIIYPYKTTINQYYSDRLNIGKHQHIHRQTLYNKIRRIVPNLSNIKNANEE